MLNKSVGTGFGTNFSLFKLAKWSLKDAGLWFDPLWVLGLCNQGLFVVKESWLHF